MTGDVPPVVRLRGVTRTYAGPAPVYALRSVDLAVPRGELLTIIGPSGSGKSTLLNILGLLDRPDDGTYELDGIDTAGLRERDRTALRAQRIGFVFQAFHLLSHRSAVENVALALLYAGVPRAERHRAAHEALVSVGLGPRADATPATMSGGERQRVAIARALVNRPSLLLCDEPTGNLDSVTSGQVLELLDALHRDGLTVVVITHDREVAARGDRTVTIRDGLLTEAVRA
jgi:putative ABC transport system ATP-binding protein